MSYFDNAVEAISSIGQYGDTNLEGEEYNRSDRSRRISDAADSLCDYVHEHILEARGEEIRFKHFTQDDLNMIAGMIAHGMMCQFEHDLEAELRYLSKQDSDDQLHAQRLDTIENALRQEGV